MFKKHTILKVTLVKKGKKRTNKKQKQKNNKNKNKNKKSFVA